MLPVFLIYTKPFRKFHSWAGCDLWCFNMSCFSLDMLVIRWFLQFGELLYEFRGHGHISVFYHFSFAVDHRGLSLVISLQMDEEFELPLDTAEIPQYTRLSLGKKLNLFLIIMNLLKKVVFLELVNRSSVVQLKRLMYWYTAGGSDYILTPCQSECSDLVSLTGSALERELWKEKTKKFKVPRWWSDALTAHGIFLKWFVWFGLQKACKLKHTTTLLCSK